MKLANLLLRAWLRAFRPLRAIADELRLLRRLLEAVAATQLNVTLPDERMLVRTPKADRVEIVYGIKRHDDAADAAEMREADVAEDELEDYLK